MNLVETYVSNITMEQRHEKYQGVWRIVADTNCYGNRKTQQELILSNGEYTSVKEYGFYLS